MKRTDFVGDCGLCDESRVSLERTTRPFVRRPRSLTGRLAGAKEMESHVVWKSLRSGKMAWTGDHALTQTQHSLGVVWAHMAHPMIDIGL